MKYEIKEERNRLKTEKIAIEDSLLLKDLER